MSDLEDILSEEPTEDVAQEVAEQEDPPQAEEEPTKEPEKEPIKESEPAMVPLSALQEVRRELQQIKQQVVETQPKREDPPPPEFIDPEGSAYLQQQMAAMQAHMVAERSEMFAKMKHGADVVDEALAAAQAAGVADQFRGSKDPWGQLTQWHKAQKLQSEIGDDPDAYKAKMRAEVEAELKADMVAENAKQVASAPSLASEPNLGSRAAPAWSGPASLNDILSGEP